MKTEPNGTIKIIKNAPIPARAWSKHKYPHRQLKVGDAFDVPIASQHGHYSMADRLGIKIVTRKISADTIRVWRVK